MTDIIIGRRGKHCAQSSPTGALNGNRPRPTALFPLHATQAGQVALAPNPALPKDQPLRGSWRNTSAYFNLHSHQSHQPLRGSWRNACVCFTLYSHLSHQLLRGRWHNASACFTLHSHQSHQPLRGSWHNASALFTPTTHQLHQPLHGRWRNVSAFLLQLCSCYTNHQMVDGVMSVYFYSNSTAVTPTATRQFVQRKPQQTCGNKRFGMDFTP